MTIDSRNEDLRAAWFGRVLPEWKLGRAKHAFRVVSKKVGARSSGYDLLSLTLKGIVPRDLESGKGKFPESFDTYQEVKKGDIVFCLFDVDETPRTVGLSKMDGMVTGAYTVVRCTKIADPRFVSYFYLSIDERKGLRPFYTGLRKVVRTETFLNAAFPLPDLTVQRQIADFLDRETARIDLLIEKKQRLVALLAEKQASQFAHFATKGLNRDVELQKTGIDWIGTIPSHWQTRRLGGIFAFRNEKNDPIRTKRILSLSIAKGVSLYSEKGRTGGNKRKTDLTAYKLAYAGDIVLNSMNVIVGAVGRSQWFGAISPVYYALYPIDKSAHVPYFEKIFLNSGFQRGLLRYGKGILIKLSGTGKLNTIRMKVSPDDLKTLQLPVPPAEEQERIASFLERESTRFNVLMSTTKSSIDRLKEYRSALITAAVTGQIDVQTYARSGTSDHRLDAIQEEMRA